MTTQPIDVDDGQLEPPHPNGVHAQPVAPVIPNGTARRRGGAPPGPRRNYDYRLRGLDLEAPALADPPLRTRWGQHPSVLRRRKRLLVQVLIVLAALVAVAGILRATVVQPYTIRSTSMVPTLHPNTDVLVLTSELLSGSPKRGDVVVLRAPEGARCAAISTGSQDLVSRIIGMPGDTIWSRGEEIFINGRLLDKPQWRNPPFGAVGPTPIERTTIPPDSYFVMGDNRTDTCDSRVFGPVHESRFVGEVVLTTLRDGHPSVGFVK